MASASAMTLSAFQPAETVAAQLMNLLFTNSTAIRCGGDVDRHQQRVSSRPEDADGGRQRRAAWRRRLRTAGASSLSRPAHLEQQQPTLSRAQSQWRNRSPAAPRAQRRHAVDRRGARHEPITLTAGAVQAALAASCHQCGDVLNSRHLRGGNLLLFSVGHDAEWHLRHHQRHEHDGHELQQRHRQGGPTHKTGPSTPPVRCSTYSGQISHQVQTTTPAVSQPCRRRQQRQNLGQHQREQGAVLHGTGTGVASGISSGGALKTSVASGMRTPGRAGHA